MKGKIFIKDWLRLKPYDKQYPTDLYYLKIANEVKKGFIRYKGFGLDKEISNENFINLLSCFLTSYFEDIISNSGIWNTFISLHNKMYGKKLPFFPTDDYVDGEINEVDVKFLIWYFVNSVQDGSIVFPDSLAIHVFSEYVMEIFEREYEYAPENEKLQHFYTLNLVDDDYYLVRHLIDTILFKTYLFFPDTAIQLEEMELEIIKSKKGEYAMQYLNDNRDYLLHKSHTSLLGLKGKDWAAEILGSEHPLFQDLKDISPRIAGYFLYKGQDDQDIFLEHIASKKQFKMTKKSYDHSEILKNFDTTLYVGLVRWQHEWWFSGVFSIMPDDAEFLEEEKKSVVSRQQVDFLDFENGKVTELLEHQMESFLKYNKGSLIAFMPTSEFEDFSKDFIAYYNDSLHLSEAQMEKSKTIKAGVEKKEIWRNAGFNANAEPGLVFFNPKSGLEMAYGIIDAFTLPSNPYDVNEEEIEDSIMTLLTSPQLSKELLMFWFEHCKKDLTFFQEGDGSILAQDIDFLLRFFKKEHYHSKPAISLV